MKKVLATSLSILLIGTMATMVKPFELAQANGSSLNAVFVAVRWVEVGKNRDGSSLPIGRFFPWQRGNEAVWGNTTYPMPRSNAPKPASQSTSTKPLYYTEFYLDVNPAGGQSQLSNHWYAVLDDSNQIWIDQDGRFQDARESGLAPDRCDQNSRKVDPTGFNNTMGPFLVGDYIHFEHDKKYPFSPRGSIGAYPSYQGNYSGRVFKIGQGELGSDSSKVFILSEVLFASCNLGTYNLSIETDLWYGIQPSATAVRLYSPFGDVQANAQSVQRSTVLDPTGTKFFAPATTFQNIRLKYRSYIGVQIWKDNGINANIAGSGNARANNLSDDYSSGQSGEEFLGMRNGENDTDALLPLIPLPPLVRFYSANTSDRLGCGSAIYEDLDDSSIVSAGDKRINHVRLNIGGVIIDYPPGSMVSEGDSDIGLPLFILSKERYHDINQDGIFDVQDYIYWDADEDAKVSNGDIRLTNVAYRGKTYLCGSQISIGDLWIYENPVTGISMGKNGDFRCLDIEVLPGHYAVSAKINPPLKVEQTSTIEVRIQPPLSNGEKAYIVLKTPSGNDFIREVRDTSPVHTFTYTPYEGSCSPLGKHEPLVLEVYRDLDKNTVGNQPPDAQYGHWKVETNTAMQDFKNRYDCKMIDLLKVEPEDIKGRLNVTCLSNIGVRYPNLIIKLLNADNPNDVNDPANMAISSVPGRNIVANYNASGAGISHFFTAMDAVNNRYIVQVNRDSSYLVWQWKDKPNPTSGKGMVGVLDLEDDVIGPFSSINGIPLTNARYEDKDCSDAERECTVCTSGSLPPLGRLTKGDTFGVFDGTFGWIETDGVWVFVTAYGHGLIGNDGGEIPLALIPREESSDLIVRVFTANALYDYNSAITHPPYFITSTGPGINYCGLIPVGWKASDPQPPPPPPDDPSPPPNPNPPGGGSGHVTFSELVVVDHALRFSKSSYDQQIKPDYDPVLRHLIRDFRPYPGGQTHTGRAGNLQREGRNAYPARWENMFVKLGTEFLPMSDYGIYFVLRDSRDGGIIHFEAQDPGKRIARIDIRGPFMTPRFPLSNSNFGGLRNIPISYDYSGEITIDSSNYKEYELLGADWTNIVNPGMREQVSYPSNSNSYLAYTKRLNYQGIPRVIVIDELTPISNGRVTIEVTTADGRKSVLVDCCDVPIEGIPVQGLEFSRLTGGIEYGKDSEFSLTVKEYTNIQNTRYANDALVYIWQDRGVRSPYGEHLMGSGDGWLTGAPESSVGTGSSTAYSSRDDLNGDGKISFNDWETEIIGSYDLATNTWSGGMIDARTFQVNNGLFTFRLSEKNRCVVDMVGIDFNENNIIDDAEILPVILTAYKYGDDNNDRSFGPLYQSPVDSKLFSHEVYLSGQTIIPIGFSSGPKKDLIITTLPSKLTAGISPENIFKGDPFTIIVKREDGSPVDLTQNGSLSVSETAGLFFDDIPSPLPDYYWLRTDLHNTSSDGISNEKLFSSSNLIQYDFSGAKQGVYKFKNFLANDAGTIKLRVLTHDRRSFGSADIVIEHPKVSYTLQDMDNNEVSKPVIGGLYQVQAQLKGADGKNLVGSGLHFLPYVTGISEACKEKPFYLAYSMEKPKPSDVYALNKPYISLFDKQKRTLNKADWFGNGCLYNQAYDGFYLLGDRNADKKIDKQDAYATSDGSVKFYLFASDAVQMGSLIGWSNLIHDAKLSDVAGGKPEDHGNSIQRRYRPDGTFFVDWFGFSPTGITIQKPLYQVTDAQGKKLSYSAFNPENPDLISAQENHLTITLDPNAKFMKGLAFYHQDKLLEKVFLKPGDRTISLKLTPGISGEGVIQVKAILDYSPYIIEPIEVCQAIMVFDVVQTAQLEIIKGHYLYTDLRSEVVIQARDAGDKPLQGDYVIIKGSNKEWKEELDSQGRASFTMTPEKAENLIVSLEKTKVTQNPIIKVWDSSLPPALELDAYPPQTAEKEVTFTGWTWPGSHLQVDQKVVDLAIDGKFSVKVQLKEGLQVVEFKSTHPKGLSTIVKAEIEAIWKGPELLVDPFSDELSEIEEYTVTGQVNPYDARVFVNETRAEVVDGKFSATIPVVPGINRVLVKAINSFAHETSVELELKVYEKTLILLTIGRMAMVVNGKTVVLDAEPFIRSSRTMVPVRAIAEAFGAEVGWEAKSETVEIALDGMFISMQIGNSIAMVGNKVYRLDAPPVIHKSRTFVPIRFIAEAFGSLVEWDAKDQVVTIQRLSLPLKK
jgi:hypothetical protein